MSRDGAKRRELGAENWSRVRLKTTKGNSKIKVKNFRDTKEQAFRPQLSPREALGKFQGGEVDPLGPWTINSQGVKGDPFQLPDYAGEIT